MHDIEPYFRWRDQYIAAEDSKSPFFRRKYNEFEYTHQLYNFYLHPQWDTFGSATLYCKILFADYDDGYALIELIGEWNDTLYNDIMYLKRKLADRLYDRGIVKFVFFCENVLNFHAAEDDYYAEWAEEVQEEGGWIVLLNVRKHVAEEMESARLQHYLFFGDHYNDLIWKTQKQPALVFAMVEMLVYNRTRQLTY
jgi:hypothetical protein